MEPCTVARIISPRLYDPGFPGESEIAARLLGLPTRGALEERVARMDASDERTAPVSSLYSEGVAKLLVL